jgi:hypothetical protein
MRLVRETLERELGAPLAAAVLFDALAAFGGRVPAGAAEITRLVRGALREAIEKRAPSLARKAKAELEEMLASAEVPTDVHRALAAGAESETAPDDAGTTARYRAMGSRPPPWPSEATTATMPALRGATTVLVIAQSSAFADRLLVALGAARVAAGWEDDLVEVDRALAAPSPPALAIVDATDVTFPPDRLARALRGAGPSTVRAVWGSDTAVGTRVLDLLEASGDGAAALSIAEGVEPLLDLVRSRGAG